LPAAVWDAAEGLSTHHLCVGWYQYVGRWMLLVWRLVVVGGGGQGRWVERAGWVDVNHRYRHDEWKGDSGHQRLLSDVQCKQPMRKTTPWQGHVGVQATCVTPA
jgi:hypothetical protein